MRDDHLPPAVVVGIDGSRSALDAALWAVDEAVSRDIPLRLAYAIPPDDAHDSDPSDAAHKLAAAEVAVRYAFTAVESTDKPVKIEVEILQAPPVRALLDASRNAAMVCVGSIGLKHFQDGQIGSTAAALASAAHCPVAIVRGHDPLKAAQRWVAVEMDAPPACDAALRHGLDEARLRGAPLRVLATWQSHFTDIHDNDAVTDGNRLAKAALERHLEQWRKRYPELDIRAVAVHGNALSYLAKNGDSIQLLVVGHDRGHGIRELVGAPGCAALHGANVSVLICESQNVL
jgi:nucleotide-binding universal stress UspA family protein